MAALVSLSFGTPRYDVFFAMGTTSFAPILVGISRRLHAGFGRLRARGSAAAAGSASAQGTWVYRMTGSTSAGDVVVAINRADGATTVAVPDGSHDELVSGGTATGRSTSPPPRSFRVLHAR